MNKFKKDLKEKFDGYAVRDSYWKRWI
jgi:hypothetical protein